MRKAVTICGKAYPCRLTIGVLKRFKDTTGLEIEEVKDVFTICTLLYMAVADGCRHEKIAAPWDSPEALVDDIALEEIERITGELFGPSGGESEKKRAYGDRPVSSALPSA